MIKITEKINQLGIIIMPSFIVKLGIIISVNSYYNNLHINLRNCKFTSYFYTKIQENWL